MWKNIFYTNQNPLWGVEKYFSFDLSPNDKKLAYTLDNSNNQDIWSYDFETGIKKRLTHKKSSHFDPFWFNAENSILYASDTAPFDLFKYNFTFISMTMYIIKFSIMIIIITEIFIMNCISKPQY